LGQCQDALAKHLIQQLLTQLSRNGLLGAGPRLGSSNAPRFRLSKGIGPLPLCHFFLQLGLAMPLCLHPDGLVFSRKGGCRRALQT
jgi:hypothetical protein